MSILTIIYNFPTVGLLFSAFLSIAYICHIIKSKYEYKKYGVEPSSFISVKTRNRAWIYSALFFLSLASFIFINPSFGRVIGYRNLYFEHDGLYTYYVAIQVHDTGEKDIVPAQIEKDDEKYYIEKVAMSNGVIIDLFSEKDDLFAAEINKSIEVIKEDGDHEDTWANCTLLNEHALSPDLVDERNVRVYDIVFMLIDIITTAATVYILQKNVEEKQNNSNEK